MADLEGTGRPSESAGASPGVRADDAGELTHVNEQGRARMVDVSGKERTHRTAVAAGKVRMSPSTVELVRTGGSKKGDVLAVAQVAGIMAAKRCSDLIPMCHPIALTGVDVRFELEPDGVAIEASCSCTGETGVEMEALTAASVAALTIYDMLKSHERGMVVEEVRLLEKDGGRSGHFEASRGAGGAWQGPAGVVEAVSVSDERGTCKHPVDAIELVLGQGVAGDAHAGAWHRQVSLLPAEAVEQMAEEVPGLGPGSFAENILVRGIDLKRLPVGATIRCGTAKLAVTQIGKECHRECEIRRATGRCVMPQEGIFAVVTSTGTVRAGDAVRVRREQA